MALFISHAARDVFKMSAESENTCMWLLQCRLQYLAELDEGIAQIFPSANLSASAQQV